MKYVKVAGSILILVALILSLWLSLVVYANRGFINSGLVIGNGSNNFTVAPDGSISLNGTGRAMIKKSFGINRLKAGGVKAPTENIIGISYVLSFAKNVDKEVMADIIIPTAYSEGTRIRISIEWAAADNTAGDVTWGIAYHIIRANNDEMLTEVTTIAIVVDSAPGIQDKLIQTDNIIIPANDIKGGDSLRIKLFRDADASEIGASDDYNNDAYLSKLSFAIIIGSFGRDIQW